MKLPKELEARTIVHHNDLLASSYSLKLNAMRLVFFAATKYNSKQAATSVEITFTEYAEAFNIKSNAVYEELVHAVEELQKSVIKLDDDKNIEAFPWVFKSRYPKSNKGKSVELIFHPDLKPLMFELSERFTPITLENMAQLDTPFSIRLYQWLKQAQDFKKHRDDNGLVRLHIDIEDIKRRAQISNGYNTADFRRYVLEPAVGKINSKTDLTVNLTTVRSGRSIIGFDFHYVVEKFLTPKPLRPRLKRRPRVLTGSDEEGQWMRANFELLLEYRKSLKKYDSSLLMSLPDLRKLATYAKIVDRDYAEKLELEIKERTTKK